MIFDAIFFDNLRKRNFAIYDAVGKSCKLALKPS